MKSLNYSFGACFLGALLLLTVPLNYMAGVILAAAFHEACHLLAIYLLGGRVRNLTLTPTGIRMEMDPLPPLKELLAAAAGPAGSLFLLIFIRTAPEVALAGAVQGFFNLLPIYPMDGGRMLKCFLGLFLSEKTRDFLCRWTEILTLGTLLFFLLKVPGPWGLILGICLFFPILSAKIPCKEETFRVQ